jgi:hypothetical protein
MGGTGSFNQNTGAQSLNEYGTAKALAERALGRDRNAQAAGRELETRTRGQDRRARHGERPGSGADVHLAERGGGPSAGGEAGRRAAAQAGGGPDTGETVYMPDNEAAGMVVGSPAGNRTRAPRKITGTDKALMENALGGLLSEMNVKALDDQTRNAVLLQAEKEWQDGAEGHATRSRTRSTR